MSVSEAEAFVDKLRRTFLAIQVAGYWGVSHLSRGWKLRRSQQSTVWRLVVALSLHWPATSATLVQQPRWAFRKPGWRSSQRNPPLAPFAFSRWHC